MSTISTAQISPTNPSSSTARARASCTRTRIRARVYAVPCLYLVAIKTRTDASPAVTPPAAAASITDIPPPLAAPLAAAGVTPDAVRVCTDTDLDLSGGDATEWLVLTDDRILTLGQPTPDSPASILTDLRYEDLKGARGDARVGSGMFEVEIAEGQFREILRYSNAHAGKFGRVARKLHQRLAQNRPLVFTSEDIWDVRRCVKCARPVLQYSGAIIRGADGRTYRICPRCVSKGQVVLRLLGLMRPYWPFALLALTLLGVTIALDLVPPRLTKVLIDTVFGGLAPSPWFAFPSGAAGAAEPLPMLVLLVILLAV